MAPRRLFEKELETLRNDMISMGEAVEALVEKTIEVIIKQDEELANYVIAQENEIDLMEVKIAKKCTELIIHQQPIARDLRLVMSILKSITDMERIADQCEDICKYRLQIKDGEWSHEQSYKRHIEKMALDVQKMLRKTLDSFVQKDVEKIREICAYDDKIDKEFGRIWKEIIEEMAKSQEFIPDGADYIMIIKYFERIADHITNIAEWLIYNITGEYETNW